MTDRKYPDILAQRDELTVGNIPAYLAGVTKRHLEEQAARFIRPQRAGAGASERLGEGAGGEGAQAGDCDGGDGEGEGGACGHKSVMDAIVFDEETAKGLSAREVKKRWPRFWGPDCGAPLIAYASAAHYIYGDW